VNEIFRLISMAFNSPICPKYEDARQGDVDKSLLDASKIKELGWQPTIGLEEGIKRTIEYMSRAGQVDKPPLSCGGGLSSILRPVSIFDN